MQYYTEIEGCTQDKQMVPGERAHMHDNINSVVHVEDHAVTWGQFFANLGWYMGPTFISTPEGTIYAENGDTKLNILINNQNYTDLGGVANTVIKDKDRLLVSYGNLDSATLQQQYNTVPNTANRYDTTKDPSSCMGSHTTTVHDRFVNMI